MNRFHSPHADMEQEMSRLLSWWHTRMTDLRGGFFGRIDGQGILHPKAEKGCVLNARILWAFSAAARYTNRYEYLESAQRAFHYLRDYFWDELYGGVFWSVDEHGVPLQTHKQVYAQAFAQYAFAEYYLLTRRQESLDLAVEIFHLLEKNALDTRHNGYFEAFSREWQPVEEWRLSDKDANEAKSQNTHLHVLESYTHLFRILPSDNIRKALQNLVDLFVQRFIDPQTGHIGLFFDEKWTLKSSGISFGHDIEASWLLWEAASLLDIPNIKELCLLIAETTLREAVQSDGSLLNERNLQTGHTDAARVWWVQAEAMVGFYNAFQLSGDYRFLHAAHQIWHYITQHLIDQNGGEWYWQIHPDGTPDIIQDKAGFWKCPYHNVRALLEILKRSGQLERH